MDDEMNILSHSLVVELAGSIGFRHSLLVQKIAWLLFRPATNALARIGLTFDRNVLQFGLSKAMGMTLEQFASSVTARGLETVPSDGPLLILSNHPGTYDSLAVTSQLGRDDLNFISGDIPFLRSLPHAYVHFFCIDDKGGRMIATRKAIRHLKNGGAMLMYGYGHIDPDPAVYSVQEAVWHIEHWAPSIDLFLKLVPETRILISMTSHVVSPKWRSSFLYRLRKDPIDRRRLVEFGQVIYQLLFPRKLMTFPKISFSPPFSKEELHDETTSERILPAVISRAKRLLIDHVAWIKSLAPK